MTDLVSLVCKYPITRHIGPHLDFSVQDVTGSSRLNLLFALFANADTHKKIIYSLLDTCGIHELSKVIDTPIVCEWFIDRYRDGSRTIEDFFDSGTSNSKTMKRYVSSVINETNELEVYSRFRMVNMRRRIIAIHGTENIARQGMNDISIYITLSRAYRASRERLITVAEWILKYNELFPYPYDIYARYIHNAMLPSQKPKEYHVAVVVTLKTHFNINSSSQHSGRFSMTTTEELFNRLVVDQV